MRATRINGGFQGAGWAVHCCGANTGPSRVQWEGAGTRTCCSQKRDRVTLHSGSEHQAERRQRVDPSTPRPYQQDRPSPSLFHVIPPYRSEQPHFPPPNYEGPLGSNETSGQPSRLIASLPMSIQLSLAHPSDRELTARTGVAVLLG